MVQRRRLHLPPEHLRLHRAARKIPARRIRTDRRHPRARAERQARAGAGTDRRLGRRARPGSARGAEPLNLTRAPADASLADGSKPPKRGDKKSLKRTAFFLAKDIPGVEIQNIRDSTPEPPSIQTNKTQKSIMSKPVNPNEKYIREHTPSADDIIFTRRQFLLRTGMGFGA